MTNTELLKQKIADSGLKHGFIAKKMGISRQTLTKKINGITLFNQEEIIALCELLKIESATEKSQIFFKGL